MLALGCFRINPILFYGLSYSAFRVFHLAAELAGSRLGSAVDRGFAGSSPFGRDIQGLGSARLRAPADVLGVYYREPAADDHLEGPDAHLCPHWDAFRDRNLSRGSFALFCKATIVRAEAFRISSGCWECGGAGPLGTGLLVLRPIYGSAVPTGQPFLFLAPRQNHFSDCQYHLQVALHDDYVVTLEGDARQRSDVHQGFF